MRGEKLAALIELARRLAGTAEGLTLDEMAAAAGVSRRTAERMRDTLAQLFPHLEEVPDPPTKRFRIPNGLEGFAQTPTTEELLELNMSATALRTAGAEPRAAALEGLERKIRAAMRRGALNKLAPDVEALVRAEAIAAQAGPRPFEEPALISKLRHAVLAMKQLRFVYAGGTTPGRLRVVTPYGLLFSRMNYLVAALDGSEQPRNWRLDRIAELEVLETPGVVPEGFSLNDYAGRSFGIYQDELQDVVLRISPQGAADALTWRFHPNQSVEPQPDGGVVVRFSVSGMLELAWHLFTWGDKVEVLQPDSLRELLVANLELALARHRSTSTTDVSSG